MTHADDRPSPLTAKVLLVDDQPANLLALQVILDPLAQELVTAGSGDEALRRLLEDDFAVILLDVQMGGLDGFQTAQLIRGRERTRTTPIIFLTAYEAPEFPAARAYTLGAVDYLVKPLVPEILRAKVAVFVELYRLRQLERQQAERHLASEARRQSEELFRVMADFAPVLLWAAGPDGRCYFVNRPWLEFTGRTLEQERGEGWAEGVHPDDRRRCLDTYRKALAGRRPFRMEYRLRRADGTYCWILDTGVPRNNSDGSFAGYLGSAIDITERRQAEDERARLLAREREARAEAEQLYREAREADRRKDEFLAVLGHELRNPLAPVRNAVHLLGQPGLPKESAEQARGMIDRQVRHMTRLVDDLLDVSRLTRGKIILRKEPINLATAVAHAVETCRPLLEARGHELEVLLPPEPVWLEADPARLAQVVTNLLTNAAKYTEGKGLIRLTAERRGGEVCLRVRDTGVGIPPEMLERVFEPFTQLERSTGSTAQWGLGIGLTLVKRLVEMHGGSVSAASAGPGQGSEFVVCLPVLEGKAAPEPEVRREAPPPARRSLRVLVVDDNADAATSLAAMLELWGHEVRVVYDGPAALAAAPVFRPEAVLLDIGLPGMDGYDVARALRHAPGAAAARLIAVSGYGSQSDQHRAREAGFDLHLTKPVDPAEIGKVLATWSSSAPA